MESFPEKPELIAKYATMLIISSYTIESVVTYWWNVHGLMIHISTFTYYRKDVN